MKWIVALALAVGMAGFPVLAGDAGHTALAKNTSVTTGSLIGGVAAGAILGRPFGFPPIVVDDDVSSSQARTASQ